MLVEAADAPANAHFPFMKLPAKFRIKVYEQFLISPAGKARMEFIGDRPKKYPANWGYGPACLFYISKLVNAEAMPIFYKYNNIFLRTCTHPNGYLSWMQARRFPFLKETTFGWYGNGGLPSAFKYLAQCPQLKKLHIEVNIDTLMGQRSPHETRSSIKAIGIKELLKIRGLDVLDVTRAPYATLYYRDIIDEEMDELTAVLQVLTQEPGTKAAKKALPATSSVLAIGRLSGMPGFATSA